MSEENKDITALEQEREELNLLVSKGLKFDITVKVRRRKKGLRGLLSRREAAEETTSFEIHQPTLSVLDRISSLALDMAVEEDGVKDLGTSVIFEARQLVRNNSKRMARIVAIAVLGEDYHITETTRLGRIKQRNDDKELDRLTGLFFRAIKPSELAVLTTYITASNNMADFINSMRSLSGARTTQPRKESIE